VEKMKNRDIDFALVASSKDPASQNILENILDLESFEDTDISFSRGQIKIAKKIKAYLVLIDEDLIVAEFLENLPINARRLIFLSKHASVSKTPSLLVHFPGNWTMDNTMGGKPRSFSMADPALHRTLVMELSKKKADGTVPERYLVGIEVTHHGPTINKACTFIEIGSSIDEWKDKTAGHIIAETVLDAISLANKMSGLKSWLGFGGPHYAPKFYETLREQNILLSHIAPKYVVDEIDEEVIRRAYEKSIIKPAGALIDWKGLKSKQRSKIIGILENIGLDYVRI